MTPSYLKYKVEQTGSYFFKRSTMSFFGDTMRNYGVRVKFVLIETWGGEIHACYELYRRKPVKHGLYNSAYFDIQTFEVINPKRD